MLKEIIKNYGVDILITVGIIFMGITFTYSYMAVEVRERVYLNPNIR